MTDMNHLPSQAHNHLDHPKIDYLGLTNNTHKYKAQHTVQPTFAGNDYLSVMGDGVKYKFVSNENIGANSAMNNEFCDLQSDAESSRFGRCMKCIKCCFVMWICIFSFLAFSIRYVIHIYKYVLTEL